MSASIKILVLLLFQLALSKLYHRNHFPQTLISLAQTYDRDKAKTCLQKRVQSVAITLRLELHTKYTTLHVHGSSFSVPQICFCGSQRGRYSLENALLRVENVLII